jgi:cell migration-inducing and hyaluronan-binding protein
LEIGTEAKPHTHRATITLTDNIKDEDFGGLGGNDRSDRGIMLMGGTLNLHGTEKNSWTKLAQTAAAGSNTIQVLSPGDWKKGQTIVLASTDYDPHQAEERTIAAISGTTITLDKKLDYMHFGKITFDVDERGEVGMLSRNILIQASSDADQTLFGGHIMAMLGSKMFVDGVELNRMGQNMHLARYPIHWHLIGDGGQGQYIKNSAIHNTYSRCVTVHGTNYLDVENNVTYNNIGHCFFLEDGVEHGNQFVHNLAILTKCHPDAPCVPTNLAPFGSTDGTNFKTAGQDAKDVLLPSDNTATTYWNTKPENINRDNEPAWSDST